MTDSLGFLDAVAGLPEQLAAAHEAAGEAMRRRRPARRRTSIRNIVVLGMGGSGIAGDVLNVGRQRGAAGAGHGAEAVPHARVRRARHARVRALVLGRHRGDALDGPRRASEAGATLVTVSSGGELAELPARAARRVPARATCRVPRSARSSRRCSSRLFRMGLLPEAHALLVQGAGAARAPAGPVPARGRPARPTRRASSPARSTARSRSIYGGGALGAVAAMRWKCDVNENAKAPAFWAAHPELDHNEICGWGQHGDVTRQVFTLVELRHGFEHERLAPRFAFTRALIEECVAQVLEVQAEGEGRLAQLLDLMYVGRLDELLPRAGQRRRPRPDRRDRRAEGGARMTDAATPTRTAASRPRASPAGSRSRGATRSSGRPPTARTSARCCTSTRASASRSRCTTPRPSRGS